MKKRTATKATRSSQPIGDDIDVELLIAAAEAHPDWEVLPKGDGIQHLGGDGPSTPKELLAWFLKKRRH
jgi:hypothetical protein